MRYFGYRGTTCRTMVNLVRQTGIDRKRLEIDHR